MRLVDKNPATRIGWRELVDHPFWQVRLPVVPMPPEPALEAFIVKYRLAPVTGVSSKADVRGGALAVVGGGGMIEREEREIVGGERGQHTAKLQVCDAFT